MHAMYNVLRFQTFNSVGDFSSIVLSIECVEHVAEHTARVILSGFVQRRASRPGVISDTIDLNIS